MILFRRFPKFFWHSPKDLNEIKIIYDGERAHYPDLAEDFTFLDHELIPYFRELYSKSIYKQNQYRRQALGLMIGTTLAPVLGILQTTLSHIIWLGIAQAALTGIVAIFGLRAYVLKAKECYISAIFKAETLRSEYFLYLGRFGTYEEDQQRQQRLIDRVAEIRLKED